MSPILAIIKKDIRSLLTSPMFYLLTGFCCLIWGTFFAFEVFSFVQRSFQLSTQIRESGLNIHHDLVSSYTVIVHYVLIFVIAALSIRFFAEEKKMKTFPILLSSPLTSFQIVFAKWLVGTLFLIFLLTISAVFPLSLLFFMQLPLGLFLLSYLGVFLILSIYMSVSMLASALTESMIVSVTLSLVSCLVILLLAVGRELTDVIWLQEFFGYLSIDRHFVYFRKGIISVPSMVFFMSWTGLFILITERVIEFHRWR